MAMAISSSMTVRLFSNVHIGPDFACGSIPNGERGEDTCSFDSSISQGFGYGRSNDDWANSSRTREFEPDHGTSHRSYMVSSPLCCGGEVRASPTLIARVGDMAH